MRFLANSAVSAINWYQKEISPKKGFCCAYHVLHGQDSCSNVVKKAFDNQGMIAGILSVFSQTKKCYFAFVALSEQGHGSSKKDNESNSSFCAKWSALEGAWCCFIPFLN